MAKVLISVFGTAGDITPTLAVGRALRREGHTVSFLTPRWPGLYVRMAGFRSLSIGKGEERKALDDARMYTTKFDGLESWRRSLVHYAFPLSSESYAKCLELVRSEDPDLVVTSSHSFCASVAAAELGKPRVSFHLYPQFLEIARSRRGRTDRPAWRFCSPLAAWLIAQEERLGLAPTAVPSLEWGISETLTVGAHDPAVFDTTGIGLPSLGFPYDDSVFESGQELDEAIRFLDGSDEPAVVVSLGSFIGFTHAPFWRHMGSVFGQMGCRFVFLGIAAPDRESLSAVNVHATGTVPLSALLPHADLAIHHGGIGTTYAALFAGVPALVVPSAFDQGYNGRIVERLGVGRILIDPARNLATAISSMLEDGPASRGAKELSSKLVPPDMAATAIARMLTDVISGG